LNRLIAALVIAVSLLFSPLLVLASEKAGSSAPMENHSEITSISLATFDYYPYHRDGGGLMIELYRAAFASQGIALEVHSFPILRGVSAMLEHKVDAFSPGLFFIDEARKQGLLEVVPTFIIQYGWFYKGENDPELWMISPAPY
jgi:hypothetical protein